MIRIEQFLFENGIERTQAESLIAQFPTIQFPTAQEFIEYFESQNITLTYETKLGVNREVFQPKDELLQKFKDFKSSTDYDYVKKYIAEQRRIQAAIDSGDIERSSNLLEGITNQPLDPFFNFIVRKMLTGSETGVLPSESLRSLLDELTKKTQQDIDTTVGVSRDELGRIISFDNYLRNKGVVKVELLDERFAIESFNYVVDKKFDQLENAITAEKNVLRRAAEFDTLFPADATGDGVVDNKDFIENLKQLIVSDSNSVAALQSRLEVLQTQLSDINELVNIKDSDLDDLNRIIAELSVERSIIEEENAVKDETIIALNEVIDATLAQLEDRVSQQLTNTTDAFDALATQIEAQSKKSEESSAKQLAAFEKAVGGLADALKPVEPQPDPENPAANVIKQILSKWDNITTISETSYSKFVRVLDILGAKKPTKSTYVFVPPANGNLFNPSEEIKQHLKWNNELKPQIKSIVAGITDKSKAEEVLKNVNDILNDGNGSLNNNGIYNTISSALDAWVNDRAFVRGVATPVIRKVSLEVGSTFPDSNDLGGSRTLAFQAASNIKKKLSRDQDQLINILTILDEIKNNGAAFGW
jgi:hypothetical protein